MESKINNRIRKRKLYVLRLLLKASYKKFKGDDSMMMATVANGFLNLGGVYVKFLQGVLLQAPIMKTWKGDRRFDVYENVPTDSVDISQFLRVRLSQEQLSKIDKVFSEPFASGSFGQVYRAMLITGQDVVIKILRPNTRNTLKKDLRLIRLVTTFLAGVITSWDVDLGRLSREFIKATMNETDYRSEVESATELYGYYFNNKTIFIPKTFVELCTEEIIVQEFVDGISIAQLLRLNKSGEDDYGAIVLRRVGSNLQTQLLHLGVELNKAILNNGPIYGDPHPGNIRLLPNNKVALLDFGIQAKALRSPNAYYALITEFWRAEYVNQPNPGKMFLSYIRFYSGRLYESMSVLSSYASKRYNKHINLDELIIKLSNRTFHQNVSREMLEEGLDNIRAGKAANNISIDRVVNPGNRFQIVVSINDGAIVRAMATYLSLITELGYRSILPYVYNETVEFAQLYLPNLQLETVPTVKLAEAAEIVYSWLEGIGRKDVELYRLMVNHLRGYA